MMNLKLPGKGGQSNTGQAKENSNSKFAMKLGLSIPKTEQVATGDNQSKIKPAGLELNLTKCVRPEFEEKEKVVKPPDREGETEPV
jgi:hypothetical protein